MSTRISSSQNKSQDAIGAVFTPLKWACFAARETGIFEDWMAGKTVCDPTMGEGNLLEALVQMGIETGCPLTDLPIQNLYGVEIQESYLNAFFEKMKISYGVEMPRENFWNGDILFQKLSLRFDILFGNPPWLNFTELPEDYKQIVKPLFFQYDLVGNAQKLLLGGSRVDFSALIIQKTIECNLLTGGKAVFFLPLSLFLNDGANQHFRTYRINGTRYHVTKILDFNNAEVFENVATRYGLAVFNRDEPQEFPITYQRWEYGSWVEMVAHPAFHTTDPLSIEPIGQSSKLTDFEPIILSKAATPRQGVNTCGANDIFFFDSHESLPNNLCRVSNKTQTNVVLPADYLFPLVVGRNFDEPANDLRPRKWVLLPYNSNGRPLDAKQILAAPELKTYLQKHESILRNRKGTMLQAVLGRNCWWAMLGVGTYNFAPFKIIWEAYGKSDFEPRIFEGQWQANQSLQAFIPLKNLQEAKTVLDLLLDKRVVNYLRSLKMEGTMNWAQPGKIKKLLRFEEDTLTLF